MYQLPKYPYSYWVLFEGVFSLWVSSNDLRETSKTFLLWVLPCKGGNPKTQMFVFVGLIQKKFSLKYFNMKEKSKKVWKSNYLPSPCFLKKVINISFNPLNFFSLELEYHLEICNAVFKSKFLFWINQAGPATRDSLKTS